MQIIQAIQNPIYELRGERVMLDFDLALLYEVETRVLNQAVKRSNGRFPEDFMFQLADDEWRFIKSLLDNQAGMSSQFVMTYADRRPRASKPYAFTEQGVAMLSGVLRSDKALQMNIAIMRAFVAVRKAVAHKADLTVQLQEIKERLGNHDGQLNQIYDAVENLLDDKAAQRKWEERERIGFKK